MYQFSWLVGLTDCLVVLMVNMISSSERSENCQCSLPLQLQNCNHIQYIIDLNVGERSL